MDLSKNSFFNNFVQAVSTKPLQYAVIVPEKAIPYLEKTETVAIDDTFDLIEDNFLLMTMAIRVHGIFLPGAWFIHSSKSAEAYQKFFQILKELVPKVKLSLCLMSSFVL